MWLCLNDTFVSIVQKNPDDPDTLTVRARRPGDIERFIPGVNIIENGGTDYRFRALVDRKTVMEAVAKRLLELDYSNFKNTVTDHELHDAYIDIWSAMMRTQRLGKNRSF